MYKVHLSPLGDRANLVKGARIQYQAASWGLALTVTLGLSLFGSKYSRAAEITLGKEMPSPEVEYRILPAQKANALIRLDDRPRTASADAAQAKEPVRILSRAESKPQPPAEAKIEPQTPINIEPLPSSDNLSLAVKQVTAAQEPPTQTKRLPIASAPAIDPAVVALDRTGMRPLDEVTVDIRISSGPLPPDRTSELESGTVDPFAYARTDLYVAFQWEPPSVLHGPLYFEDVPLVYYGQTRRPYLQPVICGVKFAGNVLALPYKMCMNPPRSLVYTLRTYPRPGTEMPCLHQCILK